MDKETFEKYIAIYGDALHNGGLNKYYNIDSKNELELLKELDKNNSTILKTSLGNLLNNISYLEKVPLEHIKTIVEVNNSHFCPPLDIEGYKQIIQKNYLSKITITITFKKVDKYNNIYVFDISFCSSIDLNSLDFEDNLVTKIIDDKEPTSVLFINKNLEDIPLTITLRTFDDVYYNSFSEDNLSTFYKAITNCFNKNKIKKLSKPLK